MSIPRAAKLAAVLGAPLWASVAAAQQQQQAEELAGAFSAFAGFMCFLFVAVPILHVVLTIFVAKDAKSRGMDGAAVWMLVTLFMGAFGFLIYVFSRPDGVLVLCPRCGNKRLQVSAKCPHCGHA